MTDAAKAEDLQDLLDHIAWTDVLQPELLKAKASFTNRLTSAVLQTAPAGEMKAEQLAGVCYGIDILLSTVETVLRRGANAISDLHRLGLNR